MTLRIGTENYMAPELFSYEPNTQESDIWAVGTILYELCNLEKAYLNPA